ncbi:LAGLIDADG family homing endonuclease [Clostridium tertium]|uniref:LAGLIDADG family homing endonuclease n=1 Tax=Clostridium tertium TaxID=1559 RepID=UPI0018AAA293|nr:LAGLIDADG family homing endonuclease [Clostridium tertium]
MTETEKAYIAGIIDGEGKIMLQKIHKNEHPAPCVSIASTTLELLEWIKNTVGKGRIISKKNYNIEKHKDCYSYVLRRNDAIQLLNDIYPYLIINTNKKRSELIINKYKSITPRNGYYTDEMLIAKDEFYKEFMEIK